MNKMGEKKIGDEDEVVESNKQKHFCVFCPGKPMIAWRSLSLTHGPKGEYITTPICNDCLGGAIEVAKRERRFLPHYPVQESVQKAYELNARLGEPIVCEICFQERFVEFSTGVVEDGNGHYRAQRTCCFCKATLEEKNERIHWFKKTQEIAEEKNRRIAQAARVVANYSQPFNKPRISRDNGKKDQYRK